MCFFNVRTKGPPLPWSSTAIASRSCKNDYRLLSNVCLPSLVGLHQCRGPEEDWALPPRIKRLDFVPPQSPDADELADRVDERLFSPVVPNTNRVGLLHSELSEKRPKIYPIMPTP